MSKITQRPEHPCYNCASLALPARAAAGAYASLIETCLIFFPTFEDDVYDYFLDENSAAGIELVRCV